MSNEYLDLSLYKKKNKIGEGSFGKVFKVQEIKTGKIFAAKISLNSIKKDPSQIIDIEREVNIMSQLEYPSIIKIIGFNRYNFENRSKPVIITEYASNGTLKDLIHLERLSKSPESWNFTKKLINIFGIASAMSFLHKHNILHRDLKPANILEDDYLFPKIADFGLSKNFHNEESMTHNSSKIKGTPIYMPPEAYSDKKNSKASDVYSFALIVYEIITLKKPYKNYSYLDILVKVYEKNERPKFDAPIRECYKNLIERCWQKEPEDRPTFTEIVEEIKNNKEFITEDVNQDEFYGYINYIENSHSSFDPSKKFNKIILSKRSYKNKNKNKKEWETFEETFDKDKHHKNISLNEGNNPSSIILQLENLCKANIGEIQGIQIRKRSEFEINSKIIGKGKLGFVRLAVDKLNNQQVAFKELYPSIDKEEEFKICRELEIMSTIDHYAIQKVYGYIEDIVYDLQTSTILTVFEENDCLDSFIQKNYQSLDFTQKYILMYGIAAAFDYLHKKNILHGKLNPKSVLINKEIEPIITNFDQARYAQTEKIYQPVIIGEPIYTAPELFKIEKEGIISSNSAKLFDVYNFSLIIYYIFTGKRAWYDVKQTMILPSKIISGERPNIPSNLPNILHLLIQACWDQDPKNRPSFSIILDIISDENFFENLDEKVDMVRFKKYQSKVITEDKFITENNFQRNNFINGIEFPQIPENKFYSNLNFKKNSNESIGNKFFDIFEVKLEDQPNDIYNIIKIKDEYSKNIDILELFSSQIQVLLTIDHPTLTKFYGCCNIPAKFYSEEKVYDSLYKYFPKYKNIPELIISSTNNVNLLSSIFNLDNTDKLIILYGIASGMSYLHEKNIVHLNLNPKNILLNYNFEPIIKIDITSRFLDKELDLFTIISEFSFFFVAPELFDIDNKKQLKSCDVYSFGMICYFLLTKISTWKNNDDVQFNMMKAKNGERPKTKGIISYPFLSLIEDCWNKDAKLRPSFKDILSKIGSPLFVKSIQDINYDKFKRYQKLIEKERIEQFQPFRLRTKNEFNIIKVISKTEFTTTKLAKDKSTNKNVIYEAVTDSNCKFIERAQLFSNINFASIIRPYDLIKPTKGNEYGIILLPFEPNGDLDSVIKSKILDYTQKCIILYGIAMGMLMLHKQDVSHKNLLPRNILFNEYLEPLISGIVIPYSSDGKLHYNISEYYEIPYIPPEIQNMNNNDKTKINEQFADVYSFGMIAYYLFTGTRPFENITNASDIIKTVFANVKRPKFTNDVEQPIINLISSCWESSPTKRPSFKEICNIISDPNFYSSQKHVFKKKKFYDYQIKLGELDFIKFSNEELELFEKESLRRISRNAIRLKGNDVNDLLDIFEFENYIHQKLDENDSNKQSFLFPANKTERLYKNDLFDSKEFNDVLNSFEDVSIEVIFPSEFFVPIINSIQKIIKKKEKKINIVIIISNIRHIINFPKIDYPPFSIVIQPSVVSICPSAFKGCKYLKHIEIPSSVTKIGMSAFEGCSSLTHIELPSSIEKIGENVFKKCSSLMEISYHLSMKASFDAKNLKINDEVKINIL